MISFFVQHLSSSVPHRLCAWCQMQKPDAEMQAGGAKAQTLEEQASQAARQISFGHPRTDTRRDGDIGLGGRSQQEVEVDRRTVE